jgi:hypothetical protein
MEFNERDYVAYRGMRVKREWVDEIRRAQEHATYLINGEVYERVTFGDEPGRSERPKTPCPGCAVKVGEYHVSGCEYEICPACLSPALDCVCTYQDD